MSYTDLQGTRHCPVNDFSKQCGALIKPYINGAHTTFMASGTAFMSPLCRLTDGVSSFGRTRGSWWMRRR